MTELPAMPDESAESPPPSRPPPLPGRLWPKVIGWLSLALGGLVLLLYLWELFTWLDKWVLSEPPLLPRPPAPPQSGWDCIPVLLATLLLAAGYLTLRRRPAAAACHAIYAVLMAAFAVLRAVYFSTVHDEAAAGGAPYQLARGLIALGYPIFLLIWFSRASIRQQVRHWDPGGPPIIHPSEP
ncbi:MAG: hypothetical protein AMJ81_11225 [Phycisphaerae bacterium SM23_33]|nr:MAG: hypothetical protein AMJ81_11225 [Phycisphaerae bacterium SM23_33]